MTFSFRLLAIKKLFRNRQKSKGSDGTSSGFLWRDHPDAEDRVCEGLRAIVDFRIMDVSIKERAFFGRGGFDDVFSR